jgi:hypothetical protein
MQAIHMGVKHGQYLLYEFGGYVVPWSRVQSWAAGIDARGQQVNDTRLGAQPRIVRKPMG